jgi:hypothetical protein
MKTVEASQDTESKTIMWAGVLGIIGIIQAFVTLAIAVNSALSSRWVGILTMMAGAVTFLLCWMIGMADYGVKGHLEVVIAGAILFGCGAITAAVDKKSKYK